MKGSYHMELEGLKRALDYIDSCGLAVSEIVTDRHVQVKKYMNDKQADKDHYFDVWHVAKGEQLSFFYREKESYEILHEHVHKSYRFTYRRSTQWLQGRIVTLILSSRMHIIVGFSLKALGSYLEPSLIL